MKRCNNCTRVFYENELTKSCKCNVYWCKQCQDLLFEPSFIKVNKDIYIKQNGEFKVFNIELFQKTIQNTFYCSNCELDLQYNET